MKLTHLSLLLLFGGCSLFAQDNTSITSSGVKITQSAPYSAMDAESKMYYPIGGHTVLALKVQGRKQNKFVFQVFSGDNLDLKSTRTEVIDKEELYFEHIATLKNKLYFFYTVYDKATTTEQLFVRRINTSEGGFDGEPELLLTAHRKISRYSYFGYLFSGVFDFKASEDQETLVVKYKANPPSENELESPDIIAVQVFDSDLKKVWGEDFTMPYAHNMMDIKSFTADAHGRAHFLIKKYKQAETWENRGDENNRSYAILIGHSGGTVDEVPLNLGSNQVDRIAMKEDNKGGIVCAGYYRKPGSDGQEGVFVSVLNTKGEIGDPVFHRFSLDFIKKYHSISEGRQKKLEEKETTGQLAMENLSLSDIHVLADGGIVITGNVFYSVCGASDARGNRPCTDHFDDVIVVKINENGDLGWMQKLPKRSLTESFRSMTSEMYTYVMFIDNLKNADLPEDRAPYKTLGKEGYVIAYRINNETGERKHLVLFECGKVNGTPIEPYILYPFTTWKNSSFVFESYAGRKNDVMFGVEFVE